MDSTVFRVETIKNKDVLAETCLEAVSFLDRFLGLMGRRELPRGEGLWIRRCSSIHMWFMRIPLDIVFVTGPETRMRVCALHRHVPPWRALPISVWGVHDVGVLELPTGTIDRCSLQTGDELCISSPSSRGRAGEPATP